MEDALDKMAAAVRKLRGQDPIPANPPIPSAPAPARRPAPRMTLGHLLALAAGMKRSLAGSMDRVPRAWLKKGQTNPTMGKPERLPDGRMLLPVPLGVARALRARG